jgi:FkbM family methyltransferase
MAPTIMTMANRDLRQPLKKFWFSIKKFFFTIRVHFSWLFSRNIYSFTANDVALYVSERHTKLPVATSIQTNIAGSIKIKVGAAEIFWPENLMSRDLPWLYHEVFDPFAINPSSYDHPDFNFNKFSWIIDAGASEGFFSVFSMARSPAKIYPVEPNKVLANALKLTLSEGITGGRVTLIQEGLSDKPGVGFLNFSDDTVCDAQVLLDSVGNSAASAGSKNERINITSIDRIREVHSLSGQGLIKMDIEGFEMAAITGARETLRTLKPNLAIAVYHEHKNAILCANLIQNFNPDYKIFFRGYYGYWRPARPYMIFAF